MLKNFEKEVLRLLTSDVLSPAQIDSVIQDGEGFSYEYTGSGYFLTIRHPTIPRNRFVCTLPHVIGEAEGIVCGFVVFIESGEVTIECHSWGELEVPAEFRIKDVKITAH